MLDASTVTLHMVCSVDGFIGKADGDLSWLETADTYEKGIVAENTEEFLKSIGCYVMGARTYEHAHKLSAEYGWPYGDTPTYVLSHRELPSVNDKVQFRFGDLTNLFNQELKPAYKNIWIVGGAMLAREALRAGLVDEIRLALWPVILGQGIPFFDRIEQELRMHLIDVSPYENGMVELRYEVVK